MTGIDEPSKRRRRVVEQATIYVMQLVLGPIKVGITGDVKNRLQNLRNSQPYMVACIGTIPGSYDLEAEIHTALASDNIGGEWFENTQDVRETLRGYFPDIRFLKTTTALEMRQSRETRRAVGGTVKSLSAEDAPGPGMRVKNVRKRLADGQVRVYRYAYETRKADA